jgi:dihydrofolate reductase
MQRVRLRTAISLDGYSAGPGQSLEAPLGVGGMRLHAWVFPLAVFRKMQGMEGGEVDASTPVLERAIANLGASIMGRHMFGGAPGDESWQGWWGTEPPFHCPVFVLTHHPRKPLVLGETTFHFVTDGAEAALARAREAAGPRDVSIAGGAHTAQQYLAMGVVDELLLHVVPTVLGRGEPFFVGERDDLYGLRLVETVAAPNVTHLRFERR